MLKSLLVLAAGLSMSTLVMAAEPVAGEDYKVLDEPVKTAVPDGKIEVNEVFWYGCPHCYALEKPLNAWVDKLPDDVVFQRIPATMGDTWTQHARAFYAAKALGIQKQMHSDFFAAIHEQGQRLTAPNDIAEFFTHYGVSKEEALEALDSFGVKSQLNQANAKMRAYKIMGVPALVVDGRYVISPRSAGSLENMPKIASALIDKVRSERNE
ncbi:thiol:disulfide interchange protein DsbA [Chromohalobacter marismortui]|uniref:Thiol:disulfide interchange protein n=1 Tax=Chromohalobacter marismortui TaxID=42055 RepID=A0A4R7NFE8_9GAMM|nr:MULTISPECIES: thiol:disulfide interchange protein DsbA/DsbL [Chromohalobacter]MCI0510034.1 thiol:disulfide interchange protein DsbA/DsbL [Chromohalobacter sp.]MCI0593807.1 thiol:disulfide interchange protein DsbA/DsbL [Chromohalobacter sp.]TDU18998.1 thiol:disulfide interchange protein DsbA [Chromohalobacter marismortui]